MILLSLLLSLQLIAQETPPEAEYPYPQEPLKYKEIKDVTPPEKKDQSGRYIYKEKNEGRIYEHEGVESPMRVDSDGTYYYGKSRSKKTTRNNGVEQPIDIKKDGTYRYGRAPSRKDYTPKGVDAPREVFKDGTYYYGEPDREYSQALYLRLGIQGPYDFRGSTDTNAPTYKDVYSDGPEFILNIDYEWELFDFFGSFLFKFGSGLGFSQGQGRFANANSGLTPQESFQFLLFPNTATASYKFKLSESQAIIPFVDFGVGYFTFVEQRNDNGKFRFGGAPVALASGGFLLGLERFGIGADFDEGYSRTWFVLQLRQHLGLDDRKDFTSTNITLGIAVGW